MKTALIVGGANGLGLSIASQLEDYERVVVFDIVPPSADIGRRLEYVPFDLTCGDFSVFDSYLGADALIITAGIGRLELFRDATDDEIDRIFAINSLGPIKLIRRFYSRISSVDVDFNCCVLVSIAGWISSPFFSLYSATKGALHHFIEAVNVELDKAGAINRILEVSPGKIDGTSFYGGKTDLNSVNPLAEEIIRRMERKDMIFIPNYETVFRGVISRYNEDHHRFGLESYDYKLKSGRTNQ